MEPISPKTSRLNGGHHVRSPRTRDEKGLDEDAIVVLDRDGIVDHISAKAQRLLDLGSRSFTGMSIFHRIPREASFRVKRMLLSLEGRKSRPMTSLLQLKTGLGPWQWYKVEGRPRRPYDRQDGIVLRLFERGSGAPQT